VLDTYVAKNVVELVLAEGDSFATALEGQKRRATLLFSDIRGFTSMTEESDASQLIGQLNEYFRGMVDAVLAEDGTLQQFIGDAILAVWGDTHTIAPEIGAARAVNSALRMKRSLQELNREWSGRQGRRPLEIGIGINHGEVVVGNIGHPMRMRFGIVGDPINTASRIESATKSYGIPILVGHSVEELTRGLFHYRDVDRVRFKGKSAAMEIHEPLAPIHELPPPWLADYHEALRIYRSGAFGEARTAFLTLAACIPEDPLCRMYLSRCETHLKNRPPGEWDAVHVLSSK
jgi:adenylate cyclase